MFRIDLGPDPTELAAITRRRRLEEERKKRIFDPKLRCLGVRFHSFALSQTKETVVTHLALQIDVNALDSQINSKKTEQGLQKERDRNFGKAPCGIRN
jgi:hypothetical protein